MTTSIYTFAVFRAARSVATFAVVVIEDMSGALEVMIWNETYTKAQAHLAVGNVDLHKFGLGRNRCMVTVAQVVIDDHLVSGAHQLLRHDTSNVSRTTGH